MSAAKLQVAASASSTAEEQGSYNVYNRIIDWLTSERMQLSNITDAFSRVCSRAMRTH